MLNAKLKNKEPEKKKKSKNFTKIKRVCCDIVALWIKLVNVRKERIN